LNAIRYDHFPPAACFAKAAIATTCGLGLADGRGLAAAPDADGPPDAVDAGGVDVAFGGGRQAAATTAHRAIRTTGYRAAERWRGWGTAGR
jgi:hypothetical protein